LQLSDLQLAEDDPVNQLPHFIAVTSEVNLFLISIFQRHLTTEMKYAVINHLEELQSTIIPDVIELLGELPTRNPNEPPF
jgi:hypothetical protein